MQLIAYYVVFMIIGDLASYLIGLFSEREYPSSACHRAQARGSRKRTIARKETLIAASFDLRWRNILEALAARKAALTSHTGLRTCSTPRFCQTTPTNPASPSSSSRPPFRSGRGCSQGMRRLPLQSLPPRSTPRPRLSGSVCARRNGCSWTAPTTTRRSSASKRAKPTDRNRHRLRHRVDSEAQSEDRQRPVTSKTLRDSGHTPTAVRCHNRK